MYAQGTEKCCGNGQGKTCFSLGCSAKVVYF